MTNPVQQSLLDNMDHILAALPAELHQSAKESVASAEPAACLAPEAVKEAVKQEINMNRDIDTNAILPLVDADETLGAVADKPSEETLASEQQWQLEQRMRECGLESLPEA